MNAAYHQKLLALPAPNPEDAWRNDWLVVGTYRIDAQRRLAVREDVFTVILRNNHMYHRQYPLRMVDVYLYARFGTHYDFPLLLDDWHPNLVVFPHRSVLEVMALLLPSVEKTS